MVAGLPLFAMQWAIWYWVMTHYRPFLLYLYICHLNSRTGK
jgi:hypothetical protein